MLQICLIFLFKKLKAVKQMLNYVKPIFGYL